MTTNDQLLKQLEKTSRRFSRRNELRESATRSMERGDFVGANSSEAMNQRLSRLGMQPDLAKGIGAREFAMPERSKKESARAIMQNTVFERILGDNDLMPISYLLLGQHRSRSIGRIDIRDRSGRRLGFGTGFLVSPRLLLTNNHVLGSPQDATHSLIEFDYEADVHGNIRQAVAFGLDPSSFFVTDEDLDFTLVAVRAESVVDLKPANWGWNRLLEEEGLIVKGEYVSIIQHPNGETKQIAMRENRVIDLLDDFMHYQTDTAPGSSGSPVFNDQWEIVALHHSGVPERFENGDIKSVDGRKWKPWMGDHRIKWIANEGVSVGRIVAFVKQLASLDSTQKKLRDELFSAEPPPPDMARPSVPGAAKDERRELNPDQPQPVVPVVTSGSVVSLSPAGATWTIPLQVTVNVGGAQLVPGSGSGSGAISPLPKPADPEQSGLQKALDDLADARRRPYFDADKNKEDCERYYSSIDTDCQTASALFTQLSELLKNTHSTQPKYRPSTEVYPFVDLHPDLKLRSIYSGRTFEPEELIREDFRIEQERAQLMQELLQRESELSKEAFEEELDFLEAQNPFNCEHVVPQSWFQKKEPMRGDVHHLFACESGCNSFRSNIPYFDFSDFEEATRNACGKRVGQKFEPEAGKGEVARATLYFLLRYPGLINDPNEFPEERLSILLRWHGEYPVSEYELHRNQAIFARQGNRNPLIDHPDWAGKLNFASGLG